MHAFEDKDTAGLHCFIPFCLFCLFRSRKKPVPGKTRTRISKWITSTCAIISSRIRTTQLAFGLSLCPKFTWEAQLGISTVFYARFNKGVHNWVIRENVWWCVLTFTATRYLPPYTPHVGPLDPVTFNLYRHTLFTPLYATRGSFGPGNI